MVNWLVTSNGCLRCLLAVELVPLVRKAGLRHLLIVIYTTHQGREHSMTVLQQSEGGEKDY